MGTITGLDYWTGLLDWTTGLTQTAKYNSFSAERKLNFLISSVTSLTLLFPGVSRGAYIFNKLHPWWLCLNPVDFKQALTTHELYQQEGNSYLLESTFTKLSIENLVPGRIRAFYFIESISSLC